MDHETKEPANHETKEPATFCIRISTNTDINKNWPKDAEGCNIDLKNVVDDIIGTELNAELSHHYDGWGHGSDGESSWFFTDVSEDLKNKILLNQKVCSFLTISE